LGAGVRQLEIVALGGSAAEHERLAGRPGLFEAARSGVGSYLAAAAGQGLSADVVGYVPACRHNVSQLPQVLAWLAEIGVSAAHLDALALKDSDQNHAWLQASLETATLNRVAAFVSGWTRPMGSLYDIAPWRVVGEGA
jgi:hypothetical protein